MLILDVDYCNLCLICLTLNSGYFVSFILPQFKKFMNNIFFQCALKGSMNNPKFLTYGSKYVLKRVASKFWK